MVFCFPSKRLRKFFSDDDDHVSASSKAQLNKPNPSTTPALDTPASSHLPPTVQLPPAVTEAEKATAKVPRIAIIIYSMYGHIAASKS